jgi:hypothetical protein
VVKARLDHPQQDAFVDQARSPIVHEQTGNHGTRKPSRAVCPRCPGAPWEDLVALSSQLEEQARHARLAICRRGFRDALKIARSSVPMRSTHWDPDPQT